jgi:hypothetical protein
VIASICRGHQRAAPGFQIASAARSMDHRQLCHAEQSFDF